MSPYVSIKTPAAEYLINTKLIAYVWLDTGTRDLSIYLLRCEEPDDSDPYFNMQFETNADAKVALEQITEKLNAVYQPIIKA